MADMNASAVSSALAEIYRLRPDKAQYARFGETIRERMKVYEQQTAPLLEYYRARGLLVELSGMGSVEEVAARIEGALV